MLPILVAGIAGIGVGAAVVVIGKFQLSSNWSNREFDGTMFIFIISIAFCGTMVGTYLKEEFATLETTKAALDLFENLFMIITGYLFKKAADASLGGGNGGQKS